MGKQIGSSLDMPLVATPSATPPAGAVTLYFKSDGLLYTKNSAGTESVVSGGSVPFASTYKFGD